MSAGGKKRSLLLRVLLPLTILGVALLSLTMCNVEGEFHTQFEAMNTLVSMDIYGRNVKSANDRAMDRIYELEHSFTATSGSPIFDLNNAGGDWSPLDEDSTELLGKTLELSALTDGAMDPTAYPAVKAWGFTVGRERIPDEQELSQLVKRIDYRKVKLDQENHRAKMPKGMALDLGASAKGYTGDQLAAQLKADGINSALLSLGASSIQTVGAKPDGSPWRIGVQDPDGNGTICVVEMVDQAMGTSGGYQRFFERDGVRYWHIMDPDTAAPARSGLTSVSVVSDSGLLCDALSTALFVMGEEQGTQLWRDHPELNFDVIFIREDGSLAVTAGLEDSFSLTSSYKDREVTLLQ